MTKKLSAIVLLLSVMLFAAGCDLLGMGEKISYDVNATSTIGGSVTGAGVYEKGATANLVAVPEAGYVFKGWYINDTYVTNSANLSFVAKENKAYEAKFLANYSNYTLTYQVKTDDYLVDLGGSVVIETTYTDNLVDLTRRKTVALNATPNIGYEFIGWKKGSTIVSTESRLSVTLLANETYVAHFESTTESTVLTGKYVSLQDSGEVLIYEFHNDNTVTIQNHVNTMSEKTVSYAVINNNLALFDTETITYLITMQGSNFSYVNNNITYAFKKVANQVTFEKDYYYVENNTTLKAFSFDLDNTGAYILQTNSTSEPVLQAFSYYVYNNKLIILTINSKQIFNYAVAGSSLAVWTDTESIVAYELKANIEDTYYAVTEDSFYAIDFEPNGNLVNNYYTYLEDEYEITSAREKYFLLQNQIVRLTANGLTVSNISFNETGLTMQIDGVATTFEKLMSATPFENETYYYENDDVVFIFDLKDTGALYYYSTEIEETFAGYYFIKNNDLIVIYESNAAVFDYTSLISTDEFNNFIEDAYIDIFEDEDYISLSIIEFHLDGTITMKGYEGQEGVNSGTLTANYFIVGDKIVTMGYDNYDENFFINVSTFTKTQNAITVDDLTIELLQPYLDATYVNIAEDVITTFTFNLDGILSFYDSYTNEFFEVNYYITASKIIVVAENEISYNEVTFSDNNTTMQLGEEEEVYYLYLVTGTGYFEGARYATVDNVLYVFDFYLDGTVLFVNENNSSQQTGYYFIYNNQLVILNNNGKLMFDNSLLTTPNANNYIEGKYISITQDEEYLYLAVFNYKLNGELDLTVYQQGEEFSEMSITNEYFIVGNYLVSISYDYYYEEIIINIEPITITSTSITTDEYTMYIMNSYIDATYRYSEGENYIDYNFELDGTMIIYSSFDNDGTTTTYYLVNNQMIILIEMIDINTVEFIDDMLIVTNGSNQSVTLYLVE